MASKISFYKLMEANIRQRGWLAALNAVALFLFMPVYALFTIEKNKVKFVNSPDAPYDLSWISDTFPGMFNGSSTRLLALCIAILAILCAVTGFAYLHSRDQQDFYHGMPVTRKRWFMVSYVAGLLIFIVPYLLFGICTLLVGQIYGLLSSAVLLRCMTALLGGILGFLICYHVAIFAMLLTGQIVTGVLASLVLLSYGELVMSIANMLSENFYKTWTYNSSVSSGHLLNCISPGSLFMRTIRASGYSSCSPLLLLNTAVMCLLLLGISLFLLKFYRAEAASNALAFPKSASVIKIMIVIPTSLFLGVMFNLKGSQKGGIWIFFISILASILLCMIIEFIYHHDLKKLLSGKISTAISIASVVLIFGFFQFDLIGYDTYLPKEDKLEGFSLSSDSFPGYFSYPEDYILNTYNEQGDKIESLDDYTSVIELAKSGIANQKQNITPEEVRKSNTSDFITITLHYTYKGGRDIYREYAVDKAEALRLLTTLCDSESYRKTLFPIFHVERDLVKEVSIQDIYKHPTALTLDLDQQNQLLDAYEQDVLNADIADLQNQSPLGELQFLIFDKSADKGTSQSTDEEHNIQIGQFYVYKSYKNTLALLDEYGYSFRTNIDSADVMSMIYYPNDGSTDNSYAIKDSPDYQFGNGITITDETKIQTMLDRIFYDNCSGILYGQLYSNTGSVEILLAGSSYPNTYVLPEK